MAQAPAPPVIPLLRISNGSILQFADVEGHVAKGRLPLVKISPTTDTDFRRRIASTPYERIVVFVPGFATSVRLAYAAAARIQSAVGSTDRVVLVDWGSAGSRTKYRQDARKARLNAPMLVPALLFLKRIAPTRELDLFAHSLGTRIVALAIPNFKREDGMVVSSVVLAAPDMTMHDYEKAILRRPEPFRHITLYVSRRDRALLLSEILHVHRRLGRIIHWRKMVADTNVVDASAVSRGFDGHGYAINELELIRDIGLTLASAPMPHPRWRRSRSEVNEWIYSPTTCASSECAPARVDRRAATR